MSLSQQNLFDAEPAAWELDVAEQRLVATVVFPAGPEGFYDYVVPDRLADPQQPEHLAEPGRRLGVPFGRRDKSVVGYCVEAGTQPALGRRLKEVASVVDSQTLLSPAMLRLTRWMANYYLCPWGQVLEAVV